ncbi:hypothetical protein M3Y98_00711300 [Aphelenchoides besseyi]|nr:hypothetical protein M3Y98_00711300 [Aphelenchoides besseyi]
MDFLRSILFSTNNNAITSTADHEDVEINRLTGKQRFRKRISVTVFAVLSLFLLLSGLLLSHHQSTSRFKRSTADQNDQLNINEDRFSNTTETLEEQIESLIEQNLRLINEIAQLKQSDVNVKKLSNQMSEMANEMKDRQLQMLEIIRSSTKEDDSRAIFKVDNSIVKRTSKMPFGYSLIEIVAVLIVAVIVFFNFKTYGNNLCIRKFDELDWRGFKFVDCLGVAEIGLQWKKDNEVIIPVDLSKQNVNTFKLIVNSRCALKFEQNSANKTFGKWTNENGQVTECDEVWSCGLKINKNGKLLSNDGKDVGCGNETIRNEITEEWMWTKIRVVDLPSDFEFLVYVPSADDGEGDEYISPRLRKSAT